MGSCVVLVVDEMDGADPASSELLLALVSACEVTLPQVNKR